MKKRLALALFSAFTVASGLTLLSTTKYSVKNNVHAEGDVYSITFDASTNRLKNFVDGKLMVTTALGNEVEFVAEGFNIIPSDSFVTAWANVKNYNENWLWNNGGIMRIKDVSVNFTYNMALPVEFEMYWGFTDGTDFSGDLYTESLNFTFDFNQTYPSYFGIRPINNTYSGVMNLVSVTVRYECGGHEESPAVYKTTNIEYNQIITIDDLGNHTNELSIAGFKEGLSDLEKANVHVLKSFNGMDIVSIENDAFYGQTSLKSVTFANDTVLRTIPYGAFRGCDITGILSLPLSIREIGNYAFENNNLSGVVLNEGLEEIDYGAFGQNNLTTFELPSTVECCETACPGCSNLESVSVRSGNEHYSLYGGSNILVENPPSHGSTPILVQGCKNSVIPTGVVIDGNAFNGTYETSYLNINLSSSIELGTSSFSDNNTLQVANIPSVSKLGMYTFRYCPNLSVLYLDKNIIMDKGTEVFGNSSPATSEIIRHIYTNATSLSDFTNSNTQLALNHTWIDLNFGYAALPSELIPTA